MGAGGSNGPDNPRFLDKDEEIASLKAELAGLAGIAQAYAEIQKRIDHEVEMREWAEREEANARREADDAIRRMDRVRMEVHAEKCVADYRRRTWAAERTLNAVKSRLKKIDTSCTDRAFKDVEALINDIEEGRLNAEG